MPRAIVPHHRSFRWRPRRQLAPQCRPPAFLHTWLDDSGSLTARLVSLSDNHFAVDVLRQTIALPSRNEQRALRMSRPGYALIREVLLLGHRQPWVFARSVLPLASLTGELRHLRKQGNRPLGAFLFSQPHLIRSPIAVAAFNADDGYVPATIAHSHLLWGRRSVFELKGKPLLVSEVFLPALCEQLRGHQPITNE